MTAIKRTYVDLVRRVGRLDKQGGLLAWGKSGDPYGWRCWAASLLAIYDTEKMIGLDLPWWNVAATREVERLLEEHPGARVFEYGAGASTAWLARRATEVVSVEHDRVFVELLREKLRPFAGVTLMERPISDGPDDYVDAIRVAGGTFDLIVIDGRYRASCLAHAIPYMKPTGVVLFDDSGRKRYRYAIEKSELIERHHYGRSFCVPYPDHTSILRHRD